MTTAREEAVGIISGGRVQALEEAGSSWCGSRSCARRATL